MKHQKVLNWLGFAMIVLGLFSMVIFALSIVTLTRLPSEGESEVPIEVDEVGTGSETESDGAFPKDVMEVISRVGRAKSASASGALYVGQSENLPIRYHGGDVMWKPLTVYLIFYGDWNQPGGSNTLVARYLVSNFTYFYSGSPRFRVNQAYGSSPNFSRRPPGTYVTAPVYVVPRIYPGGPYLFGSSLTDANVEDVVSYAISHAGWSTAPDPDGVYFVLTSSDVDESTGFCTHYCGWHTYGTFSGVPFVKYAFVGNAARCPSACSAQGVSPNGNVGVDAMINVMAHELDEMVSDPDFLEYYDAQGEESADKCAWTWGTVTRLPSGAYYNVQISTPSGFKKYLIQRQWKIKTTSVGFSQIGCSIS